MLRRRDYALYVYDIPVDILHQICTTLDVDKGWQELAAKCGYSFDKVQSFGLEYCRPRGSPTERLIGDWGVRNPTIHDFYQKLKTIDRIREMKLLEPLLKTAIEREKALAEQRKAEALQAAEEERKFEEAKKEEEQKKKEENKLSLAKKFDDSDELESKTKGDKSKEEKLQNKKSSEDYESLNLDVSSGQTKTGHKKIGIPLQTTQVYERFYNKLASNCEVKGRVDDCKKSATNNAKGNNSTSKSKPLPSQVSIEGELHLSDDELASALSLTPCPAEGIQKDIALAVSATASFSYKELSQATDGFAEGNKIGEGAFGNVYHGVLRNSKCAIKRLKQAEQWKRSKEQLTQNASELKSLMRYRHENIVQLYGFSMDEDEICLVYQFMDNGSLEDRLQCLGGTPPLSWSQRINILKGAACGIQYLHTLDSKKPLIHGDIKSSNVLLDRHFEAKVSDLGLAEYANAGQVTGMFTHVSKKDVDNRVYGSKAYLSPEYLSSGPSTKSDTYSFGVIILEACTGEKAYDERREGDRFLAPYAFDLMDELDASDWPKHLTDKKAGPWPGVLSKLLELAQKCISELKKNRPEMIYTHEQLEWISQQWIEPPYLTDIGASNSVNDCINSPATALPRLYDTNDKCDRRKQSLPCNPTMPKLREHSLVKSHSMDDNRSPMFLQRIHDLQRRDQEKIKAIGRKMFAERPEPIRKTSTVPGNFPETSMLYNMEEEDTDSFSKTLTQNDFPHLGPEDGIGSDEVDNVQLEEMEYAEEKLRKIQLFDEQNMSGSFQVEETIVNHVNERSQGDITEEPAASDGSNASEHLQGERTHQKSCDTKESSLGALDTSEIGSGGLDNKMSSFFKNYLNEMTHIDAEEPADNSESQLGDDNAGTPDMVYCGISIVEGQQMAIWLDPITEQHYAVDPATLDPVFYHQQQLQHYSQFPSALGYDNTQEQINPEPNYAAENSESTA